MDSITNTRTIVLHLESKQSTLIIGNNILSALTDIISKSKWDAIAAVVSDRVYSLHTQKIDSFLSSSNILLLPYTDSEQNKSYAYAESYFNTLLQHQYTRNSCLVGIGGGVTTDFTGYLASAYMRGIDVVYIPTSLLAMIDASIGGKVAVNIEAGKNIIGHFHQPSCIIIDIEFLKTLPLPQWRCGLSEIVKHALIGDTVSLDYLLNKAIEIGTINKPLYDCIDSSVRFKASIVEKDEFEKSIRAILNFGHTVGHAIESFFEYTVSHGEAVAIGILVESYISMKQGMPIKDFECIEKILSEYSLLPTLSFEPNDIIQHMMYDKKNIKGKVRFVLLESIGKPLIGQEVSDKVLQEALYYYLKKCGVKNGSRNTLFN